MKEIRDSDVYAYKSLRGTEKRIFAAKLALELGKGGKTKVSKKLGIGRPTINKAIMEIKTGKEIENKYYLRGRKPLIERLPNLENDIRKILDGQSQTDPDFETNRLYTRFSIRVLRGILLEKGYTDEELPKKTVLTEFVNKLGYILKPVAKTKPLKKNS